MGSPGFFLGEVLVHLGAPSKPPLSPEQDSASQNEELTDTQIWTSWMPVSGSRPTAVKYSGPLFVSSLRSPDEAEPDGEWLRDSDAIGGVPSVDATTGPLGGWHAVTTPMAAAATAAVTTLRVDRMLCISHLHASREQWSGDPSLRIRAILLGHGQRPAWVPQVLHVAGTKSQRW
jgi:hypothetical protein